GKMLTIEGIVEEVAEKGTDFSLEGIPIDGDFTQASNVQCYLREKIKPGDLQKGQPVKLKGICSDRSTYMVRFVDVIILDTKPIPLEVLKARTDETNALEVLKGLQVNLLDLEPNKWQVELKQFHLTADGAIKPEVLEVLKKLQILRELDCRSPLFGDKG